MDAPIPTDIGDRRTRSPHMVRSLCLSWQTIPHDWDVNPRDRRIAGPRPPRQLYRDRDLRTTR